MKYLYIVIFCFAFAGCFGAIQEDIEATGQVGYVSYFFHQTEDSDRRLVVRPVTLIQNRNNPSIYEGLLEDSFISEFHIALGDFGVRSDGAYHYVLLSANPQLRRDGVRIFNHQNRLQLNLNESRVIRDAIAECNFPELMRTTIEQRLAGERGINADDIQRIFFEATDDYGTRVGAVGWSAEEGFVIKLDNDYRVRIRLNNGDNFMLSSAFRVDDIFLTYDITDRFSTGCFTTEPETTPNLVPLRSSTVLTEPGKADRILIGDRFLHRVSLDRSFDNLDPLITLGFGTRFFGPFRQQHVAD